MGGKKSGVVPYSRPLATPLVVIHPHKLSQFVLRLNHILSF